MSSPLSSDPRVEAAARAYWRSVMSHHEEPSEWGSPWATMPPEMTQRTLKDMTVALAAADLVDPLRQPDARQRYLACRDAANDALDDYYATRAENRK